MSVHDGAALLRTISDLQDPKQFQELNWNGTFQEYLDIVAKNPRVARNAFERIYDMIMEYGTEEFIDAKKRLIRYNFFSDPSFDVEDAIFGLESPPMVEFWSTTGTRDNHVVEYSTSFLRPVTLSRKGNTSIVSRNTVYCYVLSLE